MVGFPQIIHFNKVFHYKPSIQMKKNVPRKVSETHHSRTIDVASTTATARVGTDEKRLPIGRLKRWSNEAVTVRLGEFLGDFKNPSEKKLRSRQIGS